MDSFTNHVFWTLTYGRNCSLADAWSNTSKDFNRFIQKLRRFHKSPIQFIRAIEAHEDSYPHIHCISQHSQALSVGHGRYFDSLLYAKWKQLWTLGLSDAQPPKSKQTPILYLIKYISKSNNSYKTLWSKMFQRIDTLSATPPIQQQSTATPSMNCTNESIESSKFLITNQLCKQYKIKQLSWSRRFAYPQFGRDSDGHTYLAHSPKIALTNAPAVTQISL